MTGRFQASEFHWQLYGDELDDMTVVSRLSAVIRAWGKRSFNVELTGAARPKGARIRMLVTEEW